MIKITYLIPVFNEKKTVTQSINQILKLRLRDKEIIIIDNGSTDGSQELIKNFKNKKNIKLVLRKKNLGYGASIKQGLRMARGKYMYIQFSDIEYDHKVSLKMFNLAKKYNADVVFGSRLKKMDLKKKLIAILNKPAFLATMLISKMYNIFYNKNFTDVIGSKFYKVETLKNINLKENYLDWDFELKNRLISGPYKILEIFTKYNARPNSEEKSVKFYHMFLIIFLMVRFKLKKIFFSS
jgi:glycosyltransferase involved in cell wall biosynthesis